MYYPLSKKKIVEVVKESFADFKHGKFRKMNLGKEVIPEKQVQSGILHELIVASMSLIKGFREGKQKHDKDIVFIKNNKFSLDVKTSTNPERIAGNRLTAGRTDYVNPSGYFLCVNFDPFLKGIKLQKPKLRKIRFGWIDASKWKPQSGRGQAATLSSETLQSLELLFKQD